MRTKTDILISRLGFTLSVLVLAAFVALVGAIVYAGATVVGGPIGWAAGLALAFAAAQALRGPCGALMGRLVDHSA
jgi:hypothetical protein